MMGPIAIRINKILLSTLLIFAFTVPASPLFAAIIPIPDGPEYPPSEDFGPGVVVNAIVPLLPCDFIGNDILAGALQVGYTVTAEDPNGILCGSYPVIASGTYGFLTAYPDDPNTDLDDEGAVDGDRMTFYLNSLPVATNVATWNTGRVVRVDIANAGEVTVIEPDQIGLGKLYSTLQEAIDAATTNTAYLSAGTYSGDVVVTDGKTLIGQRPYSTIPYPVILEGNISFLESDSTLKYIEILYPEAESYLNFTNANYENLKLPADAGVTAIDSEITVQNCIIVPQTEGYGKGIQILNMYGSTEKMPAIQNNLIINADTGIYLFSQASGGAVNGQISNNTLDANTYGIILRMHQENPLIKDNILTNSSKNAIMYTYEDGTLLDSRASNVVGDVFYGNYADIDVWCDSLQGEVTPTGVGNVYGQNPGYANPLILDYTPSNPVCDDKGFAVE